MKFLHFDQRLTVVPKSLFVQAIASCRITQPIMTESVVAYVRHQVLWTYNILFDFDVVNVNYSHMIYPLSCWILGNAKIYYHVSSFVNTEMA